MKFVVLRGVHRQDGKDYKKGAIVESKFHLDKKFPRHFKRRLDLELSCPKDFAK